MTIKLFTLHQQTKLAEKREQPYRIGLQVQKTSFIDILGSFYFPNGREVSSMVAGNSLIRQVTSRAAGTASAPCERNRQQRRQWPPQNRPRAVSTGVGRSRRKA